jgi:solute carrier family 25 protein 38
MLGAAKQLVAKEGIRALWAGVGPACIRLSAGAGLYFVVLNKLRQAFGADGASLAPPAPFSAPLSWIASLEPALHVDTANPGRPNAGNENLSTFQAVVSGAMSRTTAAMALCPVTVVKTRMVRTPCDTPPAQSAPPAPS